MEQFVHKMWQFLLKAIAVYYEEKAKAVYCSNILFSNIQVIMFRATSLCWSTFVQKMIIIDFKLLYITIAYYEYL